MYLTKRKVMVITQNLHIHMHCRFIPNSHKQLTQTPITWWTNWYPHTMEYLLLSTKEEDSVTCSNMNESQTIMIHPWENPITKAVCYMVPCTWHSRKDKTIMTANRSVIARVGERGLTRGTRKLYGVTLGLWWWLHDYVCQNSRTIH